MKVFTLECAACGTVVAGNVLERRRRMKCPRIGCERVLRFSDMPDRHQEHILDNIERYRMGD